MKGRVKKVNRRYGGCQTSGFNGKEKRIVLDEYRAYFMNILKGIISLKVNLHSHPRPS